MKSNTKLILGCILIIVGIFWGTIKEFIPDTPNTPDDSVEIVIETPEQKIIDMWSDIAGSITDSTDRLYLCLFNKEFAERVINYDATSQQVNDVYVMAAKETFGDSLKGKYNKLASSTEEAMVSVLEEENHQVSKEERQDLSNIFMGFAWSLKK